MLKSVKSLVLLSACSLIFGYLSPSVLADDQVITSTTSDAQAVVVDTEVLDIDEQIKVAENYLVTYNDRVYFDLDKAQADLIPDEIIAIGLEMESFSDSYANRTFRPGTYFRSWPNEYYGNYCGPFHSGNNFRLPAIDILDLGCQEHDNCYQWGGNNCDCNRRLINFLQVNRRWMSGEALRKSRVIQWYFETFGLIGC